MSMLFTTFAIEKKVFERNSWKIHTVQSIFKMLFSRIVLWIKKSIKFTIGKVTQGKPISIGDYTFKTQGWAGVVHSTCPNEAKWCAQQAQSM